MLKPAEKTNAVPVSTGARIGHVHLKVADIERALPFYRDILGFEETYRRPGAVFMSAGGYHHHIGANAWQSRGAGTRQPGTTGLGWVQLRAKDPASAKEARDPWGNVIRVTA